MLPTSSLSKNEKARDPVKNIISSLESVVFSEKPLQNFQFYLDIRNHQIAAKIALKIEKLGGNIEIFLIKEVTHVVTDSEDWYYNRSKTCNFINAATKRTEGKTLQKTRADAMLERVRCKNAISTKNNLQQAAQSGILIWSVEKAITWLDQITIAALSHLKKKSTVAELKLPFIKFESFDRQTRPVCKELSIWPKFNTSSTVGDTAFVFRSQVGRNMTRKTRSYHPLINPGLQPGYCEVCRVEYEIFLEHIQSEKHLNYIKDDMNYVCLDSLIHEKSSFNVFFKLHADLIGDKGFEEEGYQGVLLDKMPRSSNRSYSGRSGNVHNLIPLNDRVRCLRSRNVVNEDNLSAMRRELRSGCRLKNLQIENTQEMWDSGRPKRSICTRKRFTPDERLVSDNKNYYKVELMTNKLRSSGLGAQDKDLISSLHTSLVEDLREEEKSKSLVVKFHRLRTSELMRLNNEAENFLFPKKEDPTSEEDADADGPNTTVSSDNHSSTLLLSSEPEDHRKKVKIEDEVSLKTNCSETILASRKKRRRTHAEAFITDNKKYYKFETPGSRLRYHGSFLPTVTNKLPKNNGDCITKKIKAELTEVDEEPALECNEPLVNLDDLQFSFERIPKSEPWYQTFQRQDKGEEYYNFFNDSGYFKPFLLPYEMGTLPPLNPKICISAYSDAKKVLMEPSSASTSVGCNTPDPNSNSMQNEVESYDAQDEDSKISVDSINEAKSEEQENNIDDPIYGKRKRHKSFFISSKNSRKSPRQHASTLAILSSFIHQRKHKEKVYNSELNCTKISLPSIVEESNDFNDEINNETDYDTISKKINDFLNISEDDLYELDVPNNQIIDLNCTISAVELLSVLDKKPQEENCSCSLRLNGSSARKVGKKKKKKNRTGWPNKNRKYRREIIIKEEPEDYNADSPIFNIDSELCSEDNLQLTDFSIINNEDSQIFVNSSNKKIENKNTKELNSNSNNQSVGCVNHLSDKSDRVENEVVEMDERNSVNVDLDKWENAEKILQAKISNSECIDKDLTLQPFVRVQKLDSELALKHEGSRISLGTRRSNSRYLRKTPPSPKSPKNLRKPRGRWYRER